MAYCTKCGAQVSDGVKFCTSCGSLMRATQTQAAPQQPQQPYQQPHQQQPSYGQPYQQQPVYTEEPISTGGYVLMFFLLMIPLLNLICLLVWACGGSAKKNKINLSRALLVWMLIGAVLSGLIFLAGGLLFGEQLSALQELSTQLEGLKQQ